jgi:hypothetical protein
MQDTIAKQQAVIDKLQKELINQGSYQSKVALLEEQVAHLQQNTKNEVCIL